MKGQLEKGERLGDYEIASITGTGGMGIVYKATQVSLGRDVALKVIRDEIASESEYRHRFLREARLAASVDHPHVVTVYDVGSEDGQLFLAMQWIDGPDLKQVLERSGRLAPDRAVAIATQLAGALDAVHSVSGLIHRDVKPANALLSQVGGKDHAYLTDFGVAKPSETAEQLTRTGWTVGTTGYLSPEQIKGHEPGPGSDLYALGCLFFEALTGQPPFRAENEMAVRWAHANDQRPTASALLPALGQRYDHFLSIALAVDPGQRFDSGRAFAEAVSKAHSGEQATAITAAVPPQAPAHPPTAVGPPTPMPPRTDTPQPQTPPHPAYGYVTPPPAPAQHARSGNPLALILLAVVAIAGIAVGALAAAGVFSSNSSQTVASAARAPKRAAHRSPSKPQPEVPGTKPCGPGLAVGPATTCEFAGNVKKAYEASGGGDTTVSAYSPVTGSTYSMRCTAGTTHVCTGGNEASVYITPSGTSTASSTVTAPPPSSAPSSPSTGLHACDPNISANSATTCPFAEKAFVAYWRDYEANGEQSESVVPVYSPTTGQTYSMDCTTEGVTVDCSGGNNAFVTFPMHAVEVY